ncbi:MAG: thioesterase family protein [Leptospiraceae bacterium]|nr:thioesterase family protein [Leptospiraceae bacterium]
MKQNEQIQFPEPAKFSTTIQIRKIDLSMDLHVSFATILDIVFEAHLQFFEFLGYQVTNIHGRSIIFANLEIQYQGELFYRDGAKVEVGISNMQAKSMDLFFKLSKGQNIPVSIVKIRVLFFDYDNRKVVEIPDQFREKFPELKNAPVVSSSKSSNGKWDSYSLRSLTQEFVEKVYSHVSSFPKSEDENLSLKLRSGSVNVLVALTHSYHNKIYSDKLKWIVRLESDLEELSELLKLALRLKLSKEDAPLGLLEKIKSEIVNERNLLLSKKKVLIQKEENTK